MTESMEFWEIKKMIGAMDPVISSSIVPMEILKNNLILLFNITQNHITNSKLLLNMEASIAKRFPFHKGTFFV